MAEPHCLERARALKRHAKHCGMPLSDFVIAVSKAEAFELLAWFRREADPKRVSLETLDAAIAVAIEEDDPFPVLADFTLFGLSIAPTQALN